MRAQGKLYILYDLLSTYYECYYPLFLVDKQADIFETVAKGFLHEINEFKE